MEKMARVTKRELRVLQRLVEREFPDDPALQEVHLARKVLALEAEKAGMDYIDYVKSLRGRSRGTR